MNDAPILRVPPHSIESESSVLGGLMFDGEAFHKIADILTEDDFYRSEHRVIFAAIKAMLGARKSVDMVTLFDELQKSGQADEAGGLPYVSSLTTVFSSTNIRRHAEIVRERSILRKLMTATDEIAETALNTEGKAVSSILDEAAQKLSTLGLSLSAGKESEWVGVYESMLTHTDLLEKRQKGTITAWPTGLADLDEYLEGGLQPGTLVIVGARPSMGKTALGLTIGVNMAAERPVAMLSMEMSHAEVNDRLTAMLGNVSMSAVKRPARGEGLAWDRVMDGVERAKALRLQVSDQGGLNLNQVRAKARSAKRLHGLEVLIVDYIGLMQGLDVKANRNTQLGEISRGLKTLAKELEICVLCLAQLNRKAEERAEQMPQMSDLRDSGEIEQDADVILFIKRPIMSDPDLGDDFKHYARVAIAKNRQGRCGVIDLSYLGEQTRFASWHGSAPQKQSAISKRGGNL